MAVADQTMLDAIDAAILSIVTGKNESIGNGARSLTKLPIDKLYEMKRDFEARLAATDASDGVAVVNFTDL